MFQFFPNTDVVLELVTNNYENFKDDPDIVTSLIYNSFTEEEFNKIKAFAEQHNKYYEEDLTRRKIKLEELRNNLPKFLDALKNKQSILK
ncbi:uncharacterized protein LOC113003016 [Solenopsis invicta]|uniref:uncharacterized protein LOC113003016 n=1 Tax=Solenopsis invicta TaxID=13686 RepID=UPI00193D3A80|nr:uncharacterized protein LOC113003016 [Solenopsis invicta]